jgi:hypothetical protein
MRRPGAAALLAAMLFTTSPAAAQSFGDWKVSDGGIATRNDNGGMLLLVQGQAAILDRRRCDKGESYTVVVNPGDDKAWVAELLCHGAYDGGPYSFYEYKETSMLLTLLLSSRQPVVAIAMPLSEPAFAQISFSLRGLREAASVKWGGAASPATEDKRL